MEEPPLLESLAYDPILSKVKLIAEAWDAGGLYQVGRFPAWKRWAEWNGRYRDEMRHFLKSDGGYGELAYKRITGSEDIYDPSFRGKNASVNFLTCHDGFTLRDLYSYNVKHNENNGWNNTDGSDDNRSWNCGAEGETWDENISRLRRKLMRNAMTVLLLSRGTPMLLSGDEFMNSQKGNNNAYCQDNEISWLNWGRLEKYHEHFEFTKLMIKIRKDHPVIKKRQKKAKCGYPDVSIHNDYPWNEYFNYNTHLIGIMYAGRAQDQKSDDVIYVAINTYWEELKVTAPDPPEGGYIWEILADTAAAFDPLWDDFERRELIDGIHFEMEPRSVVILHAVKLSPDEYAKRVPAKWKRSLETDDEE
jgi:glycogen operon protein